MAKLETHFLVPIHEDISYGGALNPHNRWEKLQADLIKLFGDWTVSPGLYSGTSRDPDTGQIIRDESKQYAVALEEERIPELREYLRTRVAVIFGQKVIYFFNGREVEFVESAERTL